MKTKVSGLIVMFSAFLCGCSSYRFQGHVVGPAGMSMPSASKYRIEKFVLMMDEDIFFALRGEADPWALPTAAAGGNEIKICGDVMRRDTNLFATSGNSIPLAVAICAHSEHKDGVWSILIPCLTTLGVCPFWMGTPTSCEITVALLGDRSINQSCALDYRSDVKFSVFLPFGEIPYDDVPDATSCRKGKGLIAAPHTSKTCRADRDVVFVETLASGIRGCVREIERRTSQDALARFANVPRDDEDSPESLSKNSRQEEAWKMGLQKDEEYGPTREARVRSFQATSGNSHGAFSTYNPPKNYNNSFSTQMRQDRNSFNARQHQERNQRQSNRIYNRR